MAHTVKWLETEIRLVEQNGQFVEVEHSRVVERPALPTEAVTKQARRILEQALGRKIPPKNR
jgi:hypothetical protein